MKQLLLLFVLFLFFSCDKDDVDAPHNIYHQWRWEATRSMNPETPPIKTSEGLDTTYYYNFKKNGVVQFKDVNKKITKEDDFQINESELSLDIGDRIDLEFRYAISQDTLSLINVHGIIAYETIFKLDH